jgi:thioredoxin reductase (NADPH)
MIETFESETSPEVRETKVVGHRWSAPSFEVRDFLARNAVPYRWVVVDEPEGQRLLQAAGTDGSRLPIVVTPEGQALVAPGTAEVAAAVGLSTTPATDFYDLVVVGGGPAGLGAAVYGASEGLRTLLVERQATGGQAGQSSRIENYLGFPDGVSGAQLTDRARRQATRFGAEILTARDVVGLRAHGPARVVRFGDDTEVAAHAVVVATGVSYRDLEAPGCAELTGSGLYYGSAATEVDECADADVVVVGGANSAGQAAVFFARVAKSVTIVVRAPSLAHGMSAYLIEQLETLSNVGYRLETVVDEAHGNGHLQAVTLRHVGTGATERLDTSHAFVFIGAQPRTDWLEGTLARDPRGFLLTGPDLVVDGRRPRGWHLDRDPWPLEASIPGVFVAGDARADSVKRVASAVGEGAMAVTLAHRYLGSP